MAFKRYEKAHQAVLAAESLGSTDANIRTVRATLESRASQLYAQASQELASSPDDAKQKLRLIKSMVDQKSPWYQKADQLLHRSG